MSNSTITTTQPIQAYFSHSYRADDSGVNLAFWELFSQERFFFTIDPKSDTFIIPHLERLMRFSDCFIAVVTHRSKEIRKIGNVQLPEPQTIQTYSPYIAFENFLAEMAGKPRLVFVENDLEVGVFGEDDSVYAFDRITLGTRVRQYKDVVHNFANRVRAYINYNEQVVNITHTRKAGIFIQESQDETGYSRELISDIKDTLRVGGYTSEIIQPHIGNSLQVFLRRLSELELIIIDVMDRSTSMDALAIIQAKAIPCIRIAKFSKNDSIDSLKSLELLKDYFIGDDIPVITWNTREDLIKNIFLYLSKFKQARTPFVTFDEGKKYFISAGRKKHKVFISNSGSLNPFALELVKELQTLNIQYFQYMSSSSIEIGTVWEKELEKELSEFNIFVALINDDYHASRYCQKELDTAVDRFNKEDVTILAYLCEDTQYPKAIQNLLQGKDIHSYSIEEKIDIISKQIDKELKNNVKKEETKMKVTAQESTKKISVFLNHASEDKPLVRKLYETLEKVPWLDPWLDEKKLLPGQNWKLEINKAIEKADAVIVCISEISASKVGYVQTEIRRVIEMQETRPVGRIFMIPVRFGECEVPDHLREYHWADINEPENIDKIIKSLESLQK